MAAARPIAVVMRASAMGPATTGRLAEPIRPISSNALMIPQTVPNSPMNGVTLAVVARNVTRRSSRVASTVAARTSARERESRPRTGGGGVHAGAAHLLVHLGVAGLEDADQRAGAQLHTDGVDLGELAAAP